MRNLIMLFAGLVLGWSAQAHALALKIATLAPEGTTWMKEMRAAGAEVKTATEGRVELKFYPGGVMGNESTVLRKMKLGQLQGGAFAATELSGVYPDIQVYGLPFLFRDQAEADAVRKTLDPMIRTGIAEAGLVAPGITGGGFVYLLSTKSIDTLDAVRQTKVWTPSNDSVARIAFEAAGLTPVPLSLQDVYTALQTGLVETAGNTPVGAIAFQWHTKLKYLFNLRVNYAAGLLVLQKKAYDSLDAADQAVVDQAVGSAFERINAAAFADDAKAMAALAKQGVTILEPAPAEAAKWQAVGVGAIDTLRANKAISDEMLDAALRAREEWRAGGGKS
jgi:TRAP-type C4-dicarboxylate transport system substrate-binding protein